MKKVCFLVSFIVVMMVLPYVSCKSTPATPPAKENPPTATSAELTAAIARAEEARQRVINFEGPSYFPSEWEAAEEKYTQAKHTAQNAETLKMSLDAYNAVTDAFNSLFEKTIPLYAQAKEDEIVTLRDNLIAAGVRDSEPKFFARADEAALAAYDQYEVQDYYSARNTANMSLKMYQTLQYAYESLLAQTEIDEMEFVSYGPENYSRAGQILKDAMVAYEKEDFPVAYENASEALRLYNEVLSAGWSAYAEYRSSLADSERQAALDVKANVATRDIFSEADSSYKTGTSLFDSKQYKAAALQFINSETLFVVASTTAMEKRRNASDMIREANEKIEESAETARQAEIVLEGGSK